MPLAAAGVGAAASILGGITGGKGAKKAAEIQAASYQKGIDEQRRQFDVTNTNFAPYRDAGGQGLTGILNLLGLNGGAAQGDAYSGIEGSAGYKSLVGQSEDALLQNASATGGLRGGNTQNSLATNRQNLLTQMIQQQLASYGGLVNTGVGAVNSTAGFGQNAANNVSDLLGKQGGSNAMGAAAPYAALQGILSQLGGQFGSGGSSSGVFGPGNINQQSQRLIATKPQLF